MNCKYSANHVIEEIFTNHKIPKLRENGGIFYLK